MLPTNVYSYEQSTSSQPRSPTLPPVSTIFATIARAENVYSLSPHRFYPPFPVGPGSARADVLQFPLRDAHPLTDYLHSVQIEVNNAQEEQGSSRADSSSIENIRLEVARSAYNAKPCKYTVVIKETDWILESNPTNFEARLLKIRALFKKYQAGNKINDIKEIITQATLILNEIVDIPPKQLIEILFLRAKAYLIKANRPSIAEKTDTELAIKDFNIIDKKLTTHLSYEQTLDIKFLRGKAYYQAASHSDPYPYMAAAYQDFNSIVQTICPLNQFNYSTHLPKDDHPHFKHYVKALKFLIKIAINQKDGLGARIYANVLIFLKPNNPNARRLVNNAQNAFEELVYSKNSQVFHNQ